MDKHKLVKTRIVISMITYVLFTCFSLSLITFAWFTITNENDARLISDITEIEASYIFYVYRDDFNRGDQTHELLNQLCGVETSLCYQEIDNPTQAHLFDGHIAPGSRFGFALRITNEAAKQAYLKLDFGGVMSYGYVDEVNKIQTAFRYEVHKISFIHEGIETSDRKIYYPIVTYASHFGISSSLLYPIVKNVPTIDFVTGSSEMIVYFELYFDPEVFGFDPLGQPYHNSNVFMNQTLEIEHLYMMINMHPENQ